MARIRKILTTERSIEDIILGCKLQEAQAQKVLFERFAPRVFTTCRRYDSLHYPAKDLLQDTFIKVFANIEKFDPYKGNLYSWICRIAINLALNAIRDQKKIFVSFDTKAETYPLYEEDKGLPPSLSEEEILGLIQLLPMGYRTVFNLYIIDGFSHKEIAEELKISVSTSKSQLFKAKKILQKEVKLMLQKRYG